MPAINIVETKHRPWIRTQKLSSGVPSTTSGLLINNIQLTKIRTTTVTPGYRNRYKRVNGRYIVSRRLPDNAFTYTQGSLDNWKGWESTESTAFPPDSLRGSYIRLVGGVSSIPVKSAHLDPLTSALIQQADARARTKVLLELKAQKINLGQVYAERKQVENLIASTAKNLASSYSHLRKGNIVAAADALGVKVSNRKRKAFDRSQRRAGNNARRQARSTGSGWLALQYGWLPLLNDIYGAAEVLAERNATQMEGRVRGSVKLTLQQDLDRYIKAVNPADYNVTTWNTVDYYCKYVVRFTTPNRPLQTLSSLGITNPLVLAWELLPYSFVVDWFLPIGNWLNTFDATLGLQFAGGSVTTFKRSRVRSVATRNAVQSGNRLTGQMDYFRENINCNRSKLLSFPIPGLPSFKNPLSLTHAANAIALLSQSFKR